MASEADVDAVLGMVGLSVQVRAFESELVGLLYRGTVYVEANLPSLGRAFVKAHELGHHVLGHGNFLSTQLTLAKRQEREAQVFAGAFVFGPVLGYALARTMPAGLEGFDAWFDRARQLAAYRDADPSGLPGCPRMPAGWAPPPAAGGSPAG